ncbi:MAG: ATP-dependent DNA helicase RecG [Nitrospirales bacterium]|nr:ATP-dependent DNA helicase RecG [Nitrospirales bacterium]
MASPSDLSKIPIQYVKGVGPKRAPLLEKLGVRTVEDALWCIPWRYDNRLEILPIRSVVPGTKVTVRGIVESCRVAVTSRRRLVLITLVVRDETGVLECLFFNQPFLKNTFTPGVLVLLTGVATLQSRHGSKLMMKAPFYELLDGQEGEQEVGRIVPIYHETHGVSSKQIRRIMQGVLEQYRHQLIDVVPFSVRRSLGLPSLAEALPALHWPSLDAPVGLLNAHETAEHRRLAFEELLLLQLALAMRRKHAEQSSAGIPFPQHNPLVARFRKALPFSLTTAQERVIREISQDMSQPTAMNRLLQGDVGCGKTIVAFYAMVNACGAGYQAVLMAPTEILSEQHYASLLPHCENLGLSCHLVKGGISGWEREESLGRLQSGVARIIVGTHALLQPDVQFQKLGLVIVDEQHKFGVLQRARLREKAAWEPDVLVMTATPIPRTLAMTLYGDLDMSVIDQFPPGKKPVETKLFMRSQRKAAYGLIEKELEAGRQAYVVYPLVEPSEKVDLQAAVDGAAQLQPFFPNCRIGVLHGRLPSRDKERVMGDFRQHHIDILVATTVVEVGLDVQNATVMLIEHAERFGLAQLHQLRGRVGRGQQQGFCLLLHALGKLEGTGLQVPLSLEASRLSSSEMGTWPTSIPEVTRSMARQRLLVFAQCADGFALAEEDLKIRGSGQVLGVQQWGELKFRVADLARDGTLFMKAKEVARDLLDRDPELLEPEHHALREKLFLQWGDKFSLGVVG